MIHRDGSEEYPRGRPDRLERETPDGGRQYYRGRQDRMWWDSPDGERAYYAGRPDHLSWEYPGGEREYYEGRPDRLWWELPSGARGYYVASRDIGHKGGREMNKPKVGEWIRQGDVYFVAVKPLQRGAEPNHEGRSVGGRKLLTVAVGETTGHAHDVDVTNVDVFRVNGLDVLVSPEPIKIMHPDHGPSTLPKTDLPWAVVPRQRIWLGMPVRSGD